MDSRDKAGKTRHTAKSRCVNSYTKRSISYSAIFSLYVQYMVPVGYISSSGGARIVGVYQMVHLGKSLHKGWRMVGRIVHRSWECGYPDARIVPYAESYMKLYVVPGAHARYYILYLYEILGNLGRLAWGLRQARAETGSGCLTK